MVNARGPRFSHASGKMGPRCNFERSRAAAYCEGHAEVGMVDVCARYSSIKSHTFRGDGKRVRTGGVRTACSRANVELKTLNKPVANRLKRSGWGTGGK